MDGPIASCARAEAKRNLHRLALPSCLLLLIALLSACTAAVATPPPPFDDFNRANGALGPNWTATTDGGMAISSQALVGTNAGNSGSIRTAETYSANQSSQLQITAPQMTGSQFIGVAVRAQNGGRTLYLGTYSWNNGSPQLRLYKRINGTFTQLATFASGVLAANTTLRLSVSGSQLTVSQNSTTRITRTDTSISSGGAPAIMALGTPKADNWTGGGNTTSTPTYSVGGTVNGLSGTVVLRNNGGDDLSLTANGAFTFATRLQAAVSYAVTVKTNPIGQTCTVTNGTGTMPAANVTNISVTCTTLSFTAGGSVSGLNGTVVLQNNGADDLTLTANGPFTFPTKVKYGAGYAVTVKTNPTGQTCSVTNGTGTMPAGNVTNISVTCTTLSFGVGGSVSGLNGTVVLQNNGADDLTVTANGAFTFATKVNYGAAYAVTVETNPAGQTCAVGNGTGTIGNANVANVTVACAVNDPTDDFNRADGPLGPSWSATIDGPMAISGQAVVGTDTNSYSGNIRTAETYASDQSSQLQITGTQLTGGQWVGAGVRAQNNGLDLYLGLYWWNSGNPMLMLFERNNGTWTQLGATPSGALPAGTQLRLSAVGSSITFSQDGVSRISVTDTTLTGGAPAIMAFDTPTADNWQATGANGPAPTYSVGGTVSGLTGSVVLQDNGADDLTVSANGSFTFATPLPAGTSYAVTVKTNPTGQSCAITNPTGTVISAGVTNVAVACTTFSVGSGQVNDDFNRANGGLGSNWSPTIDGAMAISGQGVVGTKANNYSGNMRTAELYAADQSSQLQVTSQLSGGQWIGVGVRAQNNGLDLYLGLYWWNNGNPVLMVFERNNGTWTQLGATYPSGALSAGTQLQLSAVGSTITFSQNGVARIAVSDTTLTGGAPAIMAYDTPTADNWQGNGATGPAPPYSVGGTVTGLTGSSVVLQDNGADDLTVTASGPFTFPTPLPAGTSYAVTVKTQPANLSCTVSNASGIVTGTVTNVAVSCVQPGLSVTFVNKDANGVEHYRVTSGNDGPDPQTLRVLRPTHPAAGVAHNFLYALPVEPGEGTTYGDPINTLAALDAQDQYNLTIVVPSFETQPWYANDALDIRHHYETFMTSELQPWVRANLATTGSEQHWLIGFSKSGVGGEDLILKHPDLFTLVASWDFPADMSTYTQFGADNYGTEANFQANYRLTQPFVDARKAPFTTNNRIWIGAGNTFGQDVTDYNALLTSEGMQHTLGSMQPLAHRWDSGWVAGALAALAQDSVNLH